MRRLSALLLVGALACGGGKREEPAERSEDALAATPDTPVSPDTTTGAAAATPGGGATASANPAGSSSPPASANPPPPSRAAGEEGPVTVTGTVRVAGAAPLLAVTVGTPDQAWQLRGGPTGEIQRLPGAEVSVTGQPGPASAGLRTLEVSDYTIVAIRGQKPLVGRVARDQEGGLVLVADGENFHLDGAGDLGDHVGARAWVVGTVADGSLAVQSYGILSPEG